ncbi:MAG TPA: nuclear transport factor 2 family protein [Solirubrobacterales bacterium]|nr:nuclear transport factor 2 family protein [Solirubrobacterales bacterium]
MLPTTRGLDAGRAAFTRLLGAIPDLRATVNAWAADGDLVFIDFTLDGTMGGRETAWRVVDRFTLDGDRARERVSYFDPLPLLAKAAHPARWPAIAKLLAASLRR